MDRRSYSKDCREKCLSFRNPEESGWPRSSAALKSMKVNGKVMEVEVEVGVQLSEVNEWGVAEHGKEDRQ